MGEGAGMMNEGAVRRATRGLGGYLLGKYGTEQCAARGVALCYDTRHNSERYCDAAADALAGMGIKAYVFTQARPTPQLSAAVKQLGCTAGIVITASHNPKEYNGYKVYDEHGCQIVPRQAEQIAAHIAAADDGAETGPRGGRAPKERIDTTDAFVDAVLQQAMQISGNDKAALKIVYTPLHGTGNMPVRMALARDGFTDVTVVPEQEQPDGAFPTVRTPNPEDAEALAMGIELARRKNADIALGTDPDCDRVGAAAKTAGGYRALTGNQIGALLTDFIFENKDMAAICRPAVVKTAVTSELGAEIAKKHGAAVFTTLTGFKYIGEKITQFEQQPEHRHAFIFGYEESYGYLAGTHARDKDAVTACMLICEMAAQNKALGKTLFDRLDELYAEHGYYLDALDSYALEGIGGMERMRGMMARLRGGGPPIPNTARTIDYSVPVDAEPGFGKLPASDTIKYELGGGTWAAIRPSGTEPKLKIYYSAKARDGPEAQQKLADMRKAIKTRLELK
jgi:phosphoglucomutase